MALGDEKYIAFTTFRRNGTPVASPTWIVPLKDGTFGFWTSSESGKAKRLAHTERVVVQPSDGRGRTKSGTAPIEASARIVRGAELEEISAAIKAKYGPMTAVAKFMGTVIGTLRGKRMPYGDVGVKISVPS